MSIDNRTLLLNLFFDMNDFAKLKNITCPPLYILGGSACVLGGFLSRATTDIDIINKKYTSEVGRLLRILGNFDLIDSYVTSLAPGYESRSLPIKELDYIHVYILSIEDIIISKLGRNSEKDQEDINTLIEFADKAILDRLMTSVIERTDLSDIIKSDYISNCRALKEKYNV